MNSEQVILSKSDAERIRYINSYKWVGYTLAKEVMNNFEDLIELPRTSRMPSVMLMGESNNGKTVIIERFANKYPQYFDDEKEEIKQKVLMVEAPPYPDEKRFFQQILRKLLVPFRSNHKPEVLFDQVLNVFQKIELKVLIIDEIHHLLAGNSTKRQQFLNSIKSLSNQLSISIIAVGTKDAFHVFQSDPQISSRFDNLILTRWHLDREYLKFLLSYQKLLPLKKEYSLVEKDIASKILSLTNGNIGEITKILKKSAIEAINSGDEKITLDLIKRLNFTHPDKKRLMPQL